MPRLGRRDGGGSVVGLHTLMLQDGKAQLGPLPVEEVPTGFTDATAIVLGGSPRSWAFVANTGDNNITAIAIQGIEEGKTPSASKVAAPMDGDRPIALAVGNGGKTLYSLNVGNGTITVFAIRQEDGTLSRQQRIEDVPESASGLASD